MRSCLSVAMVALALLLGCSSESVPPPSVRTTDDFGLPLVIVVEVPEVPKEIRGPSPPIKEEPKETPKKSSGWW